MPQLQKSNVLFCIQTYIHIHSIHVCTQWACTQHIHTCNRHTRVACWVSAFPACARVERWLHANYVVIRVQRRDALYFALGQLKKWGKTYTHRHMVELRLIFLPTKTFLPMSINSHKISACVAFSNASLLFILNGNSNFFRLGKIYISDLVNSFRVFTLIYCSAREHKPISEMKEFT